MTDIPSVISSSMVASTGESSIELDPRRGAHRQPGLDLLRALAIVFVLVYHAGLFGFVLPFGAERFGWIGVDLFFVLSGYLIGGQLLMAVARGDAFRMSTFYRRRALRILPAYLVVVVVYFFLPPAWREYNGMPPLWKFLTFTQNLGLRGGTAFSHAWSLCIEFQFYLVLPPLILVLANRAGRLFIYLLPGAIILWCIFIRGFAAHWIAIHYGEAFGLWQQYVYYPTYARLEALTLGVSLASIEIFRPDWWARLVKQATWIWLPAVLALIVALRWAEDGLSVISSAFGFFLVAAACAVFLICAVSPRLPFAHFPIPGAAFLATIAYSLYLTHKVPIHWTEGFARDHSLPAIAAYALAILLALFAGVILFALVERPFLRLRERGPRVVCGKMG